MKAKDFRFYVNMKTGKGLLLQAISLMEQATERNPYTALLYPETNSEKRIYRAYQNELGALERALTKNGAYDKDGATTLEERTLHRHSFFTGNGGRYVVKCFANGKQIDTPFGCEVHRPYSEEENDRMKEYCVGICMGLFCKYKHPSVEIVWSNLGVERVVCAFNR